MQQSETRAMQSTISNGDDAVCRNPWAALDALSDGFAVLDTHGTIRYFNSAWQQFLEQREGEQPRFRIGSSYLNSYTAVFAPQEETLHAMTSGLQAVIQGQRERFELASPYYTNSQPMWVTFTITPCTVDGERGAMVQQRTLSGYRHIEQETDAHQQRTAALISEIRALQRANYRLEQMLAIMPLATIELDTNGTVVRWNASAERVFGWSASEMIGQNLLLKLFPEMSCEQTRQRFNHLADESAETSQRHINRTRDGHHITCQWHIRVLCDNIGAITGLLLQAEDVTEAFKAEQERAMIQERMIEAQQESLRELSTPLIPMNEQIVIMPLIGSLNHWRAQHMMQTLLSGIEKSQARIVILDITGVSSIDAQIAHDLITTAQAVRLMGAQIVLTGIRPDVAQTLVQLGITLHHIITHGTLQSGIAYAVKQQKQLMKP